MPDRLEDRLPADRLARLLDIAGLAEAEVERLDRQTRELLEAYAAGVYARIERVRARKVQDDLVTGWATTSSPFPRGCALGRDNHGTTPCTSTLPLATPAAASMVRHGAVRFVTKDRTSESG